MLDLAIADALADAAGADAKVRLVFSSATERAPQSLIFSSATERAPQSLIFSSATERAPH
jgi:hypothetical protein